jgi:hypothetical protein
MDNLVPFYRLQEFYCSKNNFHCKEKKINSLKITKGRKGRFSEMLIYNTVSVNPFYLSFYLMLSPLHVILKVKLLGTDQCNN